jgi:hypothetical protein
MHGDTASQTRRLKVKPGKKLAALPGSPGRKAAHYPAWETTALRLGYVQERNRSA